MAIVQLTHKRIGNDIQMAVQLLNNEVPLNWSEVSRIFPTLWSDSQRVRMGMCRIDGVDPQDPTVLWLFYSGKNPQYKGVARLVIEMSYMSRICTVDCPALVFVCATADEGTGPVDVEIHTNVDPEVNSLQIVVGGGGSASWGTITGDISNQTDLMQALSGKQDTIEDFSAIEAGAAAGATAYQLPVSGMPSTDMSEDVQTSLGKADTAVQPGSLKQVAFSGNYNDLCVVAVGNRAVHSGLDFIGKGHAVPDNVDALVFKFKNFVIPIDYDKFNFNTEIFGKFFCHIRIKTDPFAVFVFKVHGSKIGNTDYDFSVFGNIFKVGSGFVTAAGGKAKGKYESKYNSHKFFHFIFLQKFKFYKLMFL